LLPHHHLDTAGEIGNLLHFALLFSFDFAQGGPTGVILDIQEVDLPSLTPADDAAGGADARTLFLGQVCRQGANLLDGHVAVEAAAPRVDAQLRDAAQLVLTAGFKTILWCSHGCELSGCWS